MTPLIVKPLPQRLVLDTCVLISNVLRQGILDLARQACFAPAWSTVIGEEWLRNAARLWGIDPILVQAQWEALQQAWPQADLGDVAAFKHGLLRSDPKDWHVIAAARKALSTSKTRETVAIITRNTRDFHRGELFHLGIELLDPDQLLMRCLAHEPDCMADMLARVPLYSSAYGRPVEPLDVILKRERLFRLNRRWQALAGSLVTT